MQGSNKAVCLFPPSAKLSRQAVHARDHERTLRVANDFAAVVWLFSIFAPCKNVFFYIFFKKNVGFVRCLLFFYIFFKKNVGFVRCLFYCFINEKQEKPKLPRICFWSRASMESQ